MGNAPVDDAGVAGGLQSTSVQLGAVLGTTILGSVLSSAGAVRASRLTGAARRLGGARDRHQAGVRGE